MKFEDDPQQIVGNIKLLVLFTFGGTLTMTRFFTKIKSASAVFGIYHLPKLKIISWKCMKSYKFEIFIFCTLPQLPLSSFDCKYPDWLTNCLNMYCLSLHFESTCFHLHSWQMVSAFERSWEPANGSSTYLRKWEFVTVSFSSRQQVSRWF